ncbi:MAG TPA: hypothetical protein VGQ86_01745, partial [Candidatus Limnocylindria bacterium]|nr:hypothetical protein [Candidatus Limnocylindria bacterium]
MGVLSDFDGWPLGPLFLAIGVFDGVHVGHRALIRRVAARAKEQGGRALAATFDPLPIQALAPGAPPSALSDVDERIRLLQDAGADDVVILHFTKVFASLTATEFIDRVVAA